MCGVLGAPQGGGCKWQYILIAIFLVDTNYQQRLLLLVWIVLGSCVHLSGSTILFLKVEHFQNSNCKCMPTFCLIFLAICESSVEKNVFILTLAV